MDRFTRNRIAVAALVEERTVQRAYAGLPVRRGLVARIAAAAKRLSLPLPPGGAELLALDGEDDGAHAA